MKKLVWIWALYALIELLTYFWLLRWMGIIPLILIQILSIIVGIYKFKSLGVHLFRRGLMIQKVSTHLLDSLCLFIAAFFLVIPGVITSIIGLLLCNHFVRAVVKARLGTWIITKYKAKNNQEKRYFDM